MMRKVIVGEILVCAMDDRAGVFHDKRAREKERKKERKPYLMVFISLSTRHDMKGIDSAQHKAWGNCSLVRCGGR